MKFNFNFIFFAFVAVSILNFSTASFASEPLCPKTWPVTVLTYDTSNEPAVIPKVKMRVLAPQIRKEDLVGDRFMEFNATYLKISDLDIVGNFIQTGGNLEKDFLMGKILETLKVENQICLRVELESNVKFEEFIHEQRGNCYGTVPDWMCRKVPYHFLRATTEENGTPFHLDSDTSITTN